MNTENIIEYLEKSIAFYNEELKKDFNTGTLEIFIKGKKQHAQEMIEYLESCKEYPDAIIEVSR
jgi:hypothetical protein